MFLRNGYQTPWLCKVKDIVDTCGLSYMWCDQRTINTQMCKLIIHKRIKDLALHNWYAEISTSPMCVLYRLYKKMFDFEKYLLNCNYVERIALSKLRCANIKLPVYNTIFMYDTDICTLCNLCILGDEYHYIMICPYFRREICETLLLY